MRDPYSVIRLTNTDPKFYPQLGPFLSRRHIVHELGNAVWDDDGKVWLVAFNGTEVLGFAAVMLSKAGAKLNSAWIAPKHRTSERVAQALTAAQVAEIPADTTATITVWGDDVARYRAHGFKVKGKRGRWSVMERAGA